MSYLVRRGRNSRTQCTDQSLQQQNTNNIRSISRETWTNYPPNQLPCCHQGHSQSGDKDEWSDTPNSIWLLPAPPEFWLRPWLSLDYLKGKENVFSARQHAVGSDSQHVPMAAVSSRSIALCLARNMLSPVRPSVRLSDRWIIQKRLKLGLWNLHRTVAPCL